MRKFVFTSLCVVAFLGIFSEAQSQVVAGRLETAQKAAYAEIQKAVTSYNASSITDYYSSYKERYDEVVSHMVMSDKTNVDNWMLEAKDAFATASTERAAAYTEYMLSLEHYNNTLKPGVGSYDKIKGMEKANGSATYSWLCSDAAKSLAENGNLWYEKVDAVLKWYEKDY